MSIPTNCPSCDSVLEWSDTGVDLYCHNQMCDAKVGRKIIHFFSSIDIIDGFGPSTIETLIENGIEDVCEIYDFDIEDFIEYGFGDKTSFNLYNELQESLTRELPDFKFISALGIPSLGKGGAKKLLEHYNVEEIITGDYAIFACVEGFGDIKATEISQFIEDNEDYINSIYDLEFNIVSSKIETVDSCFTNKGMVFTGKMESNRQDMQDKAKGLGAIVQGGVTKKTDYLVTGAKVGQSKIDKAHKFGTKVISEQVFYSMII